MKALTNLARFGGIAALSTLLVAVPFGAGATVRKEGTWPAADAERKVSFEFEGNPREGLQRLAKEAGWSLVLTKGIADGAPDVRIDVDDQPAGAVLDALFAQADVVARRSGTLVTIAKDEGTKVAPTAATAPPETGQAPPIPTVRGEDRGMVGPLVVQKGEVVHDATVTGGKAIVLGTVTGDLVVIGGSATVKAGGRVLGNASTVGGGLTLEDGARVDGNVSVVGGRLERAPGAFIGGAVEGVGAKDEADHAIAVSSADASRAAGSVAEVAHALGRRISSFSLLFVLGCVLLALAGGRMDRMRTEVAIRPMRGFAMGVVGLFVLPVTLLMLCITIVGIPVAIVGVLLLVLAVYGAVAAILTTVGAALVGHRTENVYAHLLVGCLVLFVLGAIPYVGGAIALVLALTSLGLLFTTRLGGGRAERKSVRPGALV